MQGIYICSILNMRGLGVDCLSSHYGLRVSCKTRSKGVTDEISILRCKSCYHRADG